MLKQTNRTVRPAPASWRARSIASIVLPEPAQPVTTIRRSRPKRLSSAACCAVSSTSCALLLLEQRRHRHFDAKRRCQKGLQHRLAVGAGRDARVARSVVVGQHALDHRGHVREVVAVGDDLWWSVGRQHELVNADVRKRERVDDEQAALLPAVDLGDLALQRVAMVQRLAERVGHALAWTAGGQPVERPVLALQAAALDLEADDPAIGMTQNEVTLVVARALRVVAVDHARRVKDRPLVGELVA